MRDKQRGIHELYAEDPVRADELVWGRKADPVTRRGFLTRGGLVAMSAAVGASIPFAHLMPGGLIPAALAQSTTPFTIPGKEGLIVLNDPNGLALHVPWKGEFSGPIDRGAPVAGNFKLDLPDYVLAGVCRLVV